MKFLNWLYSMWGTITATSGVVVVVILVLGYFHIQIVTTKEGEIRVLNQQKAYLEMRIKDLSENGPLPQAAQKINESIKEIQKKLIPLSTLYRFDPLSATVELGVEGGMKATFSTSISHKIKEAIDYINNNNYDQASKLANEIEKDIPGFSGIDLIRFAINEKKGNSYSKETVKFADKLVEGVYIDMLSESSRNNMKRVYYWLIDYYIRDEKKNDAEELTRRAIGYWPEFEPFFEKTFGFKPTFN